MASKGDRYKQVPTLWYIGWGYPCRVMRKRKGGTVTYVPVATVRDVLQRGGVRYVETLEETKRGAELLMLYMLKVTLHDVRRAVAAGPRDEA